MLVFIMVIIKNHLDCNFIAVNASGFYFFLFMIRTCSLLFSIRRIPEHLSVLGGEELPKMVSSFGLILFNRSLSLPGSSSLLSPSLCKIRWKSNCDLLSALPQTCVLNLMTTGLMNIDYYFLRISSYFSSDEWY